MSASRWPRRLSITIACVVFVAAACGGDASPDPHHLRGPGSDGQWYAVGGVAAVGELLSFGNFVALADGVDGPITIQAIELVGVEGLHVVGVTVNGPGRAFGMVGAVPGYPPLEARQDPLPLPGAVVPGGDATTRRRGLAVTFGVRRDAPGRGYATGFAVAYTVGGAEHRAEFRTGITLCAFEGYVRGTSPQPACESVEQPG